ncbi:S8 family serine peptidase [bacterium]|nr:S8 family serine peptidase [bacterium]MBU1994460.1 S8 family serine peptidase [bacterium]
MFQDFGTKVTAALVAAVLIFSGCSDTYSEKQQTPSIALVSHTIYFGSLSNATVTIYQDEKEIISTQALAFDEQRGSRFELFVDQNIEDNASLRLVVSGGTIKGIPFTKQVRVNVSAKQLREEHIVISELSAFQELYDTQHNSTFASLVLRRSVDEDTDIDRDDLLSLLPTNTIALVHANLMQSFIESGLIAAVLEDENINVLLNKDEDNDNLSLLEEMLYCSSDLLSDSDSDGLSDYDEVQLGTSPCRADSDFDGINDKDEMSYATSPLLADTDGDYLGDGVELALFTNPLVGDEDFNGIQDGIDGDTLLFLQWHLHSEATVVNNTKNIATVSGNDLDVFKLNAQTATLISRPKIQVVDTGVQAVHEDLDVDLALSSNAINNSNDPTPVATVSVYDKTSPLSIGHGTAVAGIIAAKVQNGVGVRGMVPGASIAGSNWLESGEIQKLEDLWYNSEAARTCPVSNNSWGGYFVEDDSFEQIMEIATRELRDAKGRIFVFAAGNDRENFGNANLSYLINNPYVFAVAALNHENRYSKYSNPGSNLLVSAYGGERYYEAPTIATTLLMGKSYYENELYGLKGALTDYADTSRNYTVAMNGTSAAAPMVSSSLALTLDACPNLSWRDLKWLSAITAKKVDEEDVSWKKNSAGFWHSNNYGFGLINPSLMIELCREGYFKPLHEAKITSSSYQVVNIPIPDNNQSVYVTLNIKESLIIEWVGLEFKSNHPFSGDLNIDLIAPSGTVSNLMSVNDIKFDGYSQGFRLSSLAFLGEESLGMWKVVVRDAQALDSGFLQGLELSIRGH